MPDWLIDAATVPLKVFISDVVTRILYAAGYPIAQNGVMIMIGSYQLLVKDACSGMNSIFALSAIGVFYAYAFRWERKDPQPASSCCDRAHHHRSELHPCHHAGFDCLLWRPRLA